MTKYSFKVSVLTGFCFLFCSFFLIALFIQSQIVLRIFVAVTILMASVEDTKNYIFK